MIDYKKIALKYFEVFSNKNIIDLKELLSNKVKLKDWEISANGIKNVIKANKKIFDSFNFILVTPKRLILENNVVSAEIEITINNDEVLNIIDIIDFNKEGKITSIRAYKG